MTAKGPRACGHSFVPVPRQLGAAQQSENEWAAGWPAMGKGGSNGVDVPTVRARAGQAPGPLWSQWWLLVGSQAGEASGQEWGLTGKTPGTFLEMLMSRGFCAGLCSGAGATCPTLQVRLVGSNVCPMNRNR